MPCGAHFLISCHSCAFHFFFIFSLPHLCILVNILFTYTYVPVIDLTPRSANIVLSGPNARLGLVLGHHSPSIVRDNNQSMTCISWISISFTFLLTFPIGNTYQTNSTMAESRPKILLLGKIVQYAYHRCPPELLRLTIGSAHSTWQSLSQLGELVAPTATNREEFLKECRDGKLDGVVAAYRTFDSVTITGKIDEEVVNALPRSLKYLAHCGAGYDQVDVYACSARNPPIRVSNTPTAVDDATADVNMFLIIGALRNFNTGMAALREGRWRGQPVLGHDPQGKVLGILGMGGIGRNLKKKAEAFGMKVVYHNRRQLSEQLSEGAQYLTFDELLSSSDVISLNLPLNVSALITVLNMTEV